METSNANVFSLRNFRLVFLGALVSDLGTVLYSFAVSFYLLEISGNNAFLQGLYLALCGVVNLLATPIGGVLGDRFNKGKIMFLCDYGKGAVILLATAAMFLLRDPAAHIPVLFAAGILGNIISGIFSPAAGALMPHIVEEDQLQQANSYLSVKNALQSILGVVLAGVLYAAMPIQPLFLLVGICYVISGVSEMFIRYDHKPSQESLTLSLALRDMGDGLSYIRSQGGLMALMAAILFINFFMTPVFSNFMPYFVKTDIAGAESYLFDSFLTPELWSSVVDVILGLATLAASVFMSTRKQADKVGGYTARVLCVMALVMAGLAGAYWGLVDRGLSLNAFLIVLCLGGALSGFLIPCVNIPIGTTLMRIVDRDKLSKVDSVISIVSQGLTPIASVLAGLVLQGLGTTAMLAICAAGFAATALFMLLSKNVKSI
ncbi:MAG: MFS transporter [Oscillospiraceae bacterium]|nr:MFS transporter [Oscillospiraceae bacterium]